METQAEIMSNLATQNAMQYATGARQEAMTPQPLFRVGGVYRCGHETCPVRLIAGAGLDGFALGAEFLGRWNLTNGQWESSAGTRGDGCEWLDLLPGELTFRDGQWIAVEEAKPFAIQFPSGATVHTDGEKIVGRTGVAKSIYEILREEARTVVQQEVCIAPEPKRAPLTWNTKTPFDPFEGFTVKCDTGSLVEETAHPLQKMNEGDPRNGSAFLL